jgi:glycosyltransferase involved in cell wall biosynthesis
MAIEIVSWHPLLTDHQAYTLQGLSTAGNVSITVNVAKTQDAIRKAQGWTETNLPTLNTQVIPKSRSLHYIYHQLKAHANSIHLFSSPFEQPKLILALFLAVSMGLKVYLISEPYSPLAIGYLQEGKGFINKLKSWLRPFIYSVYGFFLKKTLEGVFAISPLAISQYKLMGIEDKNIFPFGYFVPVVSPNVDSANLPPSISEKCRIVFVGNLISRKGLDLLIESAKRLYQAGVDFYIDVYGHGNSDLFEFNSAYIRYVGQIPFGQAQSVIANYDLLVLPSRYDGWGVVVNEAILAGVPVVCSDYVGAGAVVEKWGCGILYSSNKENALYDALFMLITNSEQRKIMADITLNVRKTLTPDVAGEYMFKVISAGCLGLPKPLNPWYY